ncbi:hypothetical protein BC629DRAFT_1587980 [Irpex lacteus]|nr:hypothetical protein BC629DRAFT_1587980 [Irpex lacteus]
MAEAQPTDLVPQPSPYANTWSGKKGFALQVQMGIDGSELTNLKRAVSKAAKAARLNVHSPRFKDIENDRDGMRIFLAECSKLWPDLSRYQNGWPAKDCLRLLIRFRSNCLMGSTRKAGNTRKRRQSNSPGYYVLHHHTLREEPLPQPSLHQCTQLNPLHLESRRAHKLSPETAFAAYLRATNPADPRSLARQGLGPSTEPRLMASVPHGGGKLTLKSFQVIRTAMASYTLTIETPAPRFIDRFKVIEPTAEDIIPQFLDSIYPRLCYLLPAMQKLGIVTVYDLDAYLSTENRDEEFYKAAVNTRLMSPIEAVLVSNAFTALDAIGILPRLTGMRT